MCVVCWLRWFVCFVVVCGLLWCACDLCSLFDVSVVCDCLLCVLYLVRCVLRVAWYVVVVRCVSFVAC